MRAAIFRCRNAASRAAFSAFLGQQQLPTASDRGLGRLRKALQQHGQHHLQADVIVSDWTWALRQRARGDDLKFFPYSSALGSLMVPKGSTIKSLSDLTGKKIGVAGTGIDKSWILLRAYSRKTLGKDVADFAEPVFGAAPLISAAPKRH